MFRYEIIFCLKLLHCNVKVTLLFWRAVSFWTGVKPSILRPLWRFS